MAIIREHGATVSPIDRPAAGSGVSDEDHCSDVQVPDDGHLTEIERRGREVAKAIVKEAAAQTCGYPGVMEGLGRPTKSTLAKKWGDPNNAAHPKFAQLLEGDPDFGIAALELGLAHLRARKYATPENVERLLMLVNSKTGALNQEAAESLADGELNSLERARMIERTLKSIAAQHKLLGALRGETK